MAQLVTVRAAAARVFARARRARRLLRVHPGQGHAAARAFERTDARIVFIGHTHIAEYWSLDAKGNRHKHMQHGGELDLEEEALHHRRRQRRPAARPQPEPCIVDATIRRRVGSNGRATTIRSSKYSEDARAPAFLRT